MHQSRLESMVEALFNQFSGFVISYLLTAYVVVPLWHLEWTAEDSLAVTILFTVVSIARSYVWRRFFNAGLHKVVHAAFQRSWK